MLGRQVVDQKQSVQRRIAGGISYTLRRGGVKNINLRVRKDGSVAVSAAYGVPAAHIDVFVMSKAAWIRTAQQKLADRLAEQALQEDTLPSREQALACMQALCEKYYPQFAAICPGGTMPKVAVRDMTSRWGSCSLRTGTLAFTRKLCAMPLAAQEYVVVHEYCHFAHPNHSPAFWAEVAVHMPDYKARRALLRE